jgi:hypothetical protein
VKPDETKFTYETMHFNPGDNPDKEAVSVMTVKQVVWYIASVFVDD